MWLPNSIQIPKELIQYEMEQKVPRGSILATAAFILTQATAKNAKSVISQYALDRDAAVVAWKFLETGKIVTTDGEILSEEPDESPKKNEISPKVSSSPEVSHELRFEPTGDPHDLTEIFLSYFPNEAEPTDDQLRTITGLLSYGTQQFDDILFQMARSTKPINTPIVLAIWKLKNETADKHRTDRQRMEGKSPSDAAIVNRVVREAEAKIKKMPKPEATESRLEALNTLKERLQGGRPQ